MTYKSSLFRLIIHLPKGIRIKKLPVKNGKHKEANSQENSDHSYTRYRENIKAELSKYIKITPKTGASRPILKSNTNKIPSTKAKAPSEETKRNPQTSTSKTDQKKTTPPTTFQEKPLPSDFVKIKSTSYICIKCGDRFSNLEKLNHHTENDEHCNIISCPICDKVFASKKSCRQHLHTHREKEKYPCAKCGKEFFNPSSLKVHEMTLHTEHFDAAPDGGFLCKMCDKKTPNKREMMQHVNSKHLQSRTYLCDICAGSFTSERGLKMHLLTHDDSKPFSCQICSKAFKFRYVLKAHILRHTKERRFVCDECGKAFAKHYTLMIHKMVHSGDLPFECDFCSKRFASRSVYNTHMKNHRTRMQRVD